MVRIRRERSGGAVAVGGTDGPIEPVSQTAKRPRSSTWSRATSMARKGCERATSPGFGRWLHAGAAPGFLAEGNRLGNNNYTRRANHPDALADICLSTPFRKKMICNFFVASDGSVTLYDCAVFGPWQVGPHARCHAHTSSSNLHSPVCVQRAHGRRPRRRCCQRRKRATWQRLFPMPRSERRSHASTCSRRHDQHREHRGWRPSGACAGHRSRSSGAVLGVPRGSDCRRRNRASRSEWAASPGRVWNAGHA